jgi:hypothetical protein
VFYQDPFKLENVKTGLRLEVPDDKSLDIERSQFSKDEGMNLQILPMRNTMYTNQVYIPVRHVEPIIINIPGTSLIMRKNNNNTGVGWVARLTTVAASQNAFKIYPKVWKKIRKDFLILNYDEEVYITYQDLYIVELDENYNTLRAVYTSVENAIADGANIFFKLIPNIQVYYCDDGDCKTIPLEKTVMNDLKASYKGNAVSRNPMCWNGCDYLRADGTLNAEIVSRRMGTNVVVLIAIGVLIVGFCIWLHVTKR